MSKGMFSHVVPHINVQQRLLSFNSVTLLAEQQNKTFEEEAQFNWLGKEENLTFYFRPNQKIQV